MAASSEFQTFSDLLTYSNNGLSNDKAVDLSSYKKGQPSGQK